MLFSMCLFSVAASAGVVQTNTNDKFKTALLNAHSIYLDRFRDREKLVNLGRIIIWRIERDLIARELSTRFGRAISPGDFDFHEIRYGTLLGIASDIRKNAFATDFQMGVSLGEGDPQTGIQRAFNSFGITFTRYVLKIDPNNPVLSPSERDRFQRSASLAALFLGQGFFNAIDILKRMSA